MITTLGFNLEEYNTNMQKVIKTVTNFILLIYLLHKENGRYQFNQSNAQEKAIVGTPMMYLTLLTLDLHMPLVSLLLFFDYHQDYL